MKKSIIYLSILGVIGTMGSCSKFLEKEPISDPISNPTGDSALYKTADDAENGLKAVYSGFKTDQSELFMLDIFVNGDARSDDSYAGADNPANFQIDEFKVVSTNANVSRDWAYYYALIARANNVINNVPLVTDPALSESRRKEMIGEAAFVRAYLYFDMVRIWGEVPLVLKQVQSISAENFDEVYPLLYPVRDSVEKIYQQIISDLNTAIADGPASGASKFVATKAAAHAVLAKVYATIEPHDWNKVKEHTDAVLGSGFALLPNYDWLWDGAHENSVEAIFEIDCIDWGTGGNWGVFMFYGDDWKKFNTPSNDLVRAFDTEGDVIRKNSSIQFLDVSGKWTDRYWPATTYPFINKGRDFSGGQNYILIRLADIILLKAEALNELGDLEGARALVDQVRDRVNLEGTTAASQQDMRLAIEKERRLELAFEGHRWYDLVRTDRAIPVMNAVTDGSGANLNYGLNEQKLLWPIPQSERDKNNKLTQNPGY